MCAAVGALLLAAGADCWDAGAAGAGSVSRAKIFGWEESEGEGEAASGFRAPAEAIARPDTGAVGEGEAATVTGAAGVTVT